MQNQSSPAQLLFPTVPANYCPEGRWSDIFNSFIQLYLNNGTVNIPGLNQVTPAQIATIQQNILNLQNEYNALAINTRTGSITSPATGFQTQTVTFTTPMPNNTYTINVVFVNDGTATTAPASFWSLVAGSKTTTGFSFVTNLAANGNEKISSIDYTVQSITSN